MDAEIKEVACYFNSPTYLQNPVAWDGTTNSTRPLNRTSEPFVHVFNTTGLLQHNDIAPQWHPTDVGQIKVAFSLIQYIRMKFGWELELNGPELFHETLYWNDQSSY